MGALDCGAAARACSQDPDAKLLCLGSCSLSREQVVRSSEMKSNLEEIAKFVLAMLSGNIGRTWEFVYLFFPCR